jgi:Leucine-rich repeat (LRR) protein
LKPLKGLRLHNLGLFGTSVKQWRDLAELDFCELDVGSTSFNSLTHIVGKPLTKLELFNTSVSSIQETKGMPLRHLQIGKTKIRDFSPLSNLPLDSLYMLNCDADNLSFLYGLDLTQFGFTFSYETKGVEHLRRMRRLKAIFTTEHDFFSPDEFWQRFEKRLPLNEGGFEHRLLGERLALKKGNT